MARTNKKNKITKDRDLEPIVTRPRRHATRRSVMTYRESSDSEQDEEKELRQTQKASKTKTKDDDSIDTKVTAVSSEDEGNSDEEVTAKTKLATKKQAKTTARSKKKDTFKKVKKTNDQLKEVNKKRKRFKVDDIDDSQYIVSPPKKTHQTDDDPVDWRVQTAIDY